MRQATTTALPAVVATLQDDLWSHVVGRAYHAHAHLLARNRRFGIEYRAEAKVGKLAVAIAREQQVLGLDVAMHKTLRVYVLQRQYHLPRDEARLVLADPDPHIRP